MCTCRGHTCIQKLKSKIYFPNPNDLVRAGPETSILFWSGLSVMCQEFLADRPASGMIRLLVSNNIPVALVLYCTIDRMQVSPWTFSRRSM